MKASLLGIVIGITIGSGLTWTWARAQAVGARLFYIDKLNEQLDRAAALHYQQLEAMRRGTDIGVADENAWQVLQRLRAEMQGSKVLRLDRTRTVRAERA